MPPVSSAGSNAARQLSHKPAHHIWISDDLLTSSFHRFALTCRPSLKRNGSNVPGPLEARRRLARRRMNDLATTNDAMSNLPPPPPPPSWSKSGWFDQLWRRDPESSWTYQPPTSPANLPLPSWLEHVSPDLNTYNHKDVVTAQKDLHRYEESIARSQEFARIHASATDLELAVEGNVNAARESLRKLVYLQLFDQLSNMKAGKHFEVAGLEKHLTEAAAALIVYSPSDSDRDIQTSKLEAYVEVWTWAKQQSEKSIAQDKRLYRYLLDRISARRPTMASCSLLLDMLEHAPAYKQLKASAWTSNVILHLLRCPDEQMQVPLRDVLNRFAMETCNNWLEATLNGLQERFDSHVRFLGADVFRQTLSQLRDIVTSCSHRKDALVVMAEVLLRRLTTTDDDLAVLIALPDTEICNVLQQLFSLNMTPTRANSVDEQSYLGRAPNDVPNERFVHLAPYFELISQSQDNINTYRRCINIILNLLLEQGRAEDMAYLAERVNRSLTFSLPVPQKPLKQWLDRYSAAFPKTSVRVSKLCTSPELQIRDTLIDLIKAPDVTTGALDHFTWREVCKDRTAYMQSLGLDATTSSSRACLSPDFAKILHVFAIAYAREKRLGYFNRFNRIYRLYKHLRLQRAEIRPIMSKLLTLTGVILPLMEGETMEGGRVQFVIRAEHVEQAVLPLKQDLMQLGRLDPAVRRPHVERWADEVYGANWRHWVGIEEGEKVQARTQVACTNDKSDVSVD